MTVIAKPLAACLSDSPVGSTVSAAVVEKPCDSRIWRTIRIRPSRKTRINHQKPSAMTEETDTQKPDSEAIDPASAGSASVVKPFVECPICGKIWPHDGHAADVCCGGCSHNFYVPPDALLRRLQSLERGIMLIESMYIDGDDTHDSWRAMGETAKALIEQN